jgi:DNA gyrase/topoisomerase IV subunit B
MRALCTINTGFALMRCARPRQYDSVKDLRYGHLMIMTDQDHDGSHIKGLIINMFQCFWPSLMR